MDLVTPEWIAKALAMRAEVRAAAGGGGQCSGVSEWAARDLLGHARYGYGGYYYDRRRDAVVAHYWVNLPDGRLLDLTADQFGEGDDWRLLSPGDPRRAAYVFDWDDRDTDPAIADFDHLRPKGWTTLVCEVGCRLHQAGTAADRRNRGEPG